MFDPSPIGIGLKNGYLQNLVLHNGSENHVSHVPFNIHLGGIPHFQTHPYHWNHPDRPLCETTLLQGHLGGGEQLFGLEKRWKHLVFTQKMSWNLWMSIPKMCTIHPHTPRMKNQSWLCGIGLASYTMRCFGSSGITQDSNLMSTIFQKASSSAFFEGRVVGSSYWRLLD